MLGYGHQLSKHGHFLTTIGMLAFLCTTSYALSPALYLSFEGNLVGRPGGPPLRVTGAPEFVAGPEGQAVALPAGSFLTFASKGLLNKSRGAVAFWLRPNWNGDDGKNHALLADVSDFNDKSQNTFYLWKWSTGHLRLDLRCPADPYITADVRHWKAGEWHHIGASWDAERGLALYVDGQCVARREARYEPRSWPVFNIGGDWANQGTGDAVFDELFLFDRPLEASHMSALKEGQPLEELVATKISAPAAATIGQPFVVRVEAQAREPLKRDYPLVIYVDGVEVGRAQPEPPASRWPAGRSVSLNPISVAIPGYLRLLPGRHTLSVRFEGAVTPASVSEPSAKLRLQPAPEQKPVHQFTIGPDGQPLRDGKPFPPAGSQEGFLHDGIFYRNDTEGRAKACALIRSGLIQDAIPCRLLDAVDCTSEDHGFRQWGETRVEELLPGRKFRVTGPPESVKEEITVYGRKQRCLPGFAYRLATRPLPKLHILVAELPNDRERYTEIAIDAAPGSVVAPHLEATGPGETRLIDLSVVYTGREYPCDGSVIRHCLLFYPKSDACEVTITSSGHMRIGHTQNGAAVARLAVYEILEDEAALANHIALPAREQARTASLFFPEHRFLYTQWGFAGIGQQQRRASLLALFDYMKFIGLNRLEFHPVAFGMQCYYNGGMLPNAAPYDVFDDILPLAEERGIQIVPALDGMAFYDKFEEFTAESFQLDRDGKTYREYFGKVPDPLRPEVQARLTRFLSEFLERTQGSKAVPMIAFKVNGKMGTCYSGDAPDRPAEDAGYSEWDIAQFEHATGIKVGGTPGDTPSRYAWLSGDPERWQRWIDWRCEATREFWLKLRDLAVSRGKQALLIKTILPNNHPGWFNFWEKRKRSPLEVLRGHGYDPRLYLQEKGLRFTRCLLVGSDRYFGQEANKTWQYDDTQADFYRTVEGTETELYFIYWELADHPLGFRVGPAAGPGRAFFEPLTYTLRLHNPYNIGFYNWYAGTIGHELALRRFLRAYRALPATPPRAFEGDVSPRDPRICVRWHGDRLAVINDTPKPRRVQVVFPQPLPLFTKITDLGRGVILREFRSREATRVDVELEAWDFTTLDIQPPVRPDKE